PQRGMTQHPTSAHRNIESVKGHKEGHIQLSRQGHYVCGVRAKMRMQQVDLVEGRYVSKMPDPWPEPEGPLTPVPRIFVADRCERTRNRPATGPSHQDRPVPGQEPHLLTDKRLG